MSSWLYFLGHVLLLMTLTTHFHFSSVLRNPLFVSVFPVGPCFPVGNLLVTNNFQDLTPFAERTIFMFTSGFRHTFCIKLEDCGRGAPLIRVGISSSIMLRSRSEQSLGLYL